MAAAGSPGGAAETARALWRWNKAIAELGGRPHYAEVPPGWLAARLCEIGFGEVRVSVDERQEVRSCDEQVEILRLPVTRPDWLDNALWLALDRCRRDLLRQAAHQGLAQWSGWYRVSARIP